MEIVSGVFQILRCCLSIPACSYIDHHRKLKRSVEDLRTRVGDLNCKKADIEAQLKLEDPMETQVRKEVENWLAKVERINDEMTRIEEKLEIVSCFCRGRLGERVRQRIEEAERISQQGSFSDGLVIDKSRAASGITLPVGILEGEVHVKEQVWRYLNTNEVGMIGIWGIGGVGKTTITKHIHNELVTMEPGRFDKVIWVTVSHPLSIRKLQYDIAKEIGKEFPEEEEEMRWAARLLNAMERLKFVLILDDVWDRLSFEEVGIPKPTMENGCKVVITTRSEDVCNYLECLTVKVNPLSNQESLNLFLAKVGLGRDVMDDYDFGGILRSIVDECDGLPLAIVVIAGTMKGVSDIHEWRNALRELRKCVVGGTIRGNDDQIFNRLKFSYDRLPNSTIQQCFLSCSLFEEDFLIARHWMIEHWIDEGLIEELGSRQEMHDQGHTILNMLEKNSLLDQTGKDREMITMHDVVRDMALHIMGTCFMVKARMKLRKVPEEHEWSSDLEKVSLIYNEIENIPPNISPKCFALTTLLLCGNERLRRIPESFFSNMPELKVLDLSHCRNLEALPTSTSKLKHITSLDLAFCINLEHVPSLKELKALKKLDLQMTKIKVVPEGLGMLINLQYLDLFCPKLVELPVGIFRNLIPLQILRVHHNSGRIGGEDMSRLKELESFEGRLDLTDFNNFVKAYKDSKKLTFYQIVVGSNGWEIGERDFATENFSSWCNTVRLAECEIGGENNSHLTLPDKLVQLGIYRCNILRGLNDISAQSISLNQLISLIISGCEGISCLVDMVSSSFSSFKFNNTEFLFLENLPNLQVLVKQEGPLFVASTSPPLPIFPNLTTLSVYQCPRMKKLITVELLQSLQNLKKIRVKDCTEMEEIIGWEEEELGNHTTATPTTFTPKLECLMLYGLPELRRIAPGREVMVFDFLVNIDIVDCPKLERIPNSMVGISEVGQS